MKKKTAKKVVKKRAARHKWITSDGGRLSTCLQCGLETRIVDKMKERRLVFELQAKIEEEWTRVKGSLPPCGKTPKKCPHCGGSGLVVED